MVVEAVRSSWGRGRAVRSVGACKRCGRECPRGDPRSCASLSFRAEGPSRTGVFVIADRVEGRVTVDQIDAGLPGTCGVGQCGRRSR